MSFAATAGQNVNLEVTNQSTDPAGQYVYYTIYAPDGTYLNAATVLTDTVLTLSSMPSTGSYQVFVDPYYGSTVAATVEMTSP